MIKQRINHIIITKECSKHYVIVHENIQEVSVKKVYCRCFMHKHYDAKFVPFPLKPKLGWIRLYG
jgi:hypothetical protein